MAKVVKSFILKSISGRLGEFVVRQYKGKTIVSMRPDRSGTRLSKKQKKHQERFKRAVRFAKRVMANERLMAKYEGKTRKRKSIYPFLVGEYLRAGNGKR